MSATEALAWTGPEEGREDLSPLAAAKPLVPITVADYGMGNLGSVLNMLRRLGVPAAATSDPHAIARARKLLLPGVGAFDQAMQAIDDQGLRAPLEKAALDARVPVLGICLGMQLLLDSSEEGRRRGLGWIPGTSRRFPASASLKVPHMGWNVARPLRPSLLTAGLGPEPRFYFVHSYYAKAADRADALLETTYGVPFDAAVGRGNVLGAQFHPEKSHRFGLRLLRNFAEA